MSTVNSITPKQAHHILQSNSNAKLIDTRTLIEFSFVGHPIDAIHVPLKRPPQWETLIDFVSNIEKEIPNKSTPIVLMCRSGVRSMAAAVLLAEAGYQELYNMEEGFEGDKDKNNHRGTLGGWRFHGLPWEQS